MCRHKQQLLAANRLSAERIISVFGPVDPSGVILQYFNILLDFAEHLS